MRYTLSITDPKLAQAIEQHLARRKKEDGLSANLALVGLIRAGLEQRTTDPVLDAINAIKAMLENGAVVTTVPAPIQSSEPKEATAGLDITIGGFAL